MPGTATASVNRLPVDKNAGNDAKTLASIWTDSQQRTITATAGYMADDLHQVAAGPNPLADERREPDDGQHGSAKQQILGNAARDAHFPRPHTSPLTLGTKQQVKASSAAAHKAGA